VSAMLLCKIASLIDTATAQPSSSLAFALSSPHASTSSTLTTRMISTQHAHPLQAKLGNARDQPHAASAAWFLASALCSAAVAIGRSRASRRRFARCRRQAQSRDDAAEGPNILRRGLVLENRDVAEGLRLISLEVPQRVSLSLLSPGQSVEIFDTDASGERRIITCTCNAPGAEGIEILVEQSASLAWLSGLGRGNEVLLRPVRRSGFDLQRAWSSAVAQVALFATGAGIGPMRAVIESGALDGRVCRLYVGAGRHSALAFADSFDAWRRRGIEVIPVLSSGRLSDPGRTGTVEDAFRVDEERGEGFVLPARHGALLCGEPAMVAGVRALYRELGVPDDRLLEV